MDRMDRKTDPILSVIIPVYNAEETLERCVKSLYRQGMNELSFEVLLINDGSTDRSLELCNSLSSLHTNIRVINKENGGVASSRNVGLSQARGRWIAFLDDDDYLLDNGYAKAFLPFSQRKDIDVIRYFSSYDSSPIQPIEDGVISEGRVWDLLKANKTFLPSFVWLQFYKREYIHRHNFCFQNVAMFDDYVFASSVFLSNPYLLTVKANILRYSVREGNGTSNHSPSYSRKVARGVADSYKILCDIAKKYHVTKDSELWNICLSFMNERKKYGITRILSSKYSYKEYKRERAYWQETGFCPIIGRSDKVVFLMNQIMSQWVIYKLCSILYIRFFEPFIMPRIRKHLK